MKNVYTKNLQEIRIGDLPEVGGKNASLGEMIQGMSAIGIDVPGGFAVTVSAYKHFVNHNTIAEKIQAIAGNIDVTNIKALQQAGKAIRDLFENATFPEDLEQEIVAMYVAMQVNPEDVNAVAVRSSATAEDLPDASFAGQQESFLNVQGVENVIASIKQCFASLYTDRAISYRNTQEISQTDVYLSVVVQRMVRSDVGESGVAFSIDPETGFRDAVVINGIYGLGELIVQGTVVPDEFIVHKPTLKKGFESIISKKLGTKEKMMMNSGEGKEATVTVDTPPVMQEHFCLADDTVLELAEKVCKIENYYSELHGKKCPVDIEWAYDGILKKLFIVQARPETVHSNKNNNTIKEYIVTKNGDEKKIIEGIAVGSQAGSGKAVFLTEEDRNNGFSNFKKGDVLVTDMTDPDWEPIMKIASAIVTNKGGRTCHAAIVARELGVPAVVGTANGTKVIPAGEIITVSCAEGEKGVVYEGELVITVNEIDANNIPDTETNVMLNLASPETCFKHAQLPNDGVGLVRQEFIFNNYIKVHPLALLNHKEIGDQELSAEITKLVGPADDEETFFVDKMAQGIGKIAASFYGKEVIVRLSDFKSNEYANLLGGKYYEPEEENPMIGWRGASRYYSDNYQKAFELECKAIKKAREVMGFTNIVVMIPFCRTVDECVNVQMEMAKYGLIRGTKDLKIYLMAEVPSNVILAESFAKYVDGFSIGSNDLTQLVLGLDRDSSLVAHLFDERNEAVKAMISMLIKKAKKAGKKVGICGQGPSDHPDFAQFLVAEGIHSMSVTPDSVMQTKIAISEIETNKQSKRAA